MRRFQLYFYSGATLVIEGANYLDAVVKFRINTAHVSFYKEL